MRKRGLSASRNRTGYLRKLQNVQRTTRKNCPSVSVRLVNPSVTKSHPVTSPSVPENLNRWSWNSSANPVQIWNGWITGEILQNFLLSLNMTEDAIRLRDHSPEELSHYSKGTTDIEYKFPVRLGRAVGIADRTDYDLTCHREHKRRGYDIL